MTFRTDDTENWGLPLVGPGLLLDVPGAGRWSGRPSLHVEFTSRFRLRVSSGGQPLFWVRIDDWWHGCGVLRGTISTPWGLPPLSASRVTRLAARSIHLTGSNVSSTWSGSGRRTGTGVASQRAWRRTAGPCCPCALPRPRTMAV
ncbi:hypothetical protein [Archangium violaceum]|uniref:hypothetical protein n=1 Tax=Archangium violaceum TaxID=83451 RepID=UPI0036D87ADC